jgi:hypothetical protein
MQKGAWKIAVIADIAVIARDRKTKSPRRHGDTEERSHNQISRRFSQRGRAATKRNIYHGGTETRRKLKSNGQQSKSKPQHREHRGTSEGAGR